MRCKNCGRELTAWDEGYFKKMVNRGATECCCIPCTAAHFGLTEEKAWEMIRRFQKMRKCRRIIFEERAFLLSALRML